MDKVIGYDGKEIKLHILTPPGELLKEELAERKITQTEFAGRLGMRQSHLNEILQGKRRMSAQMALKLEKELGASAEFWMGLQTRYDLEVERQKNHEAYA